MKYSIFYHFKSITYLISLLLICSCINPQKKSEKTTKEDSLWIVGEVGEDSIKHWKLKTFVDEFGDPTDSKYIRTEVDGLFSNSATSDSYLFVEILVKKTSAGILLHEYKKSKPPVKPSGSVHITMKNSNGKILKLTSSSEWNQNGGILINDFMDNYSKFRNFLKKSTGKIKFVIRDEYSSKYNFTVDATGFTKEFNRL